MYRTRIFFLNQKSQIEYRLQITEQKKKSGGQQLSHVDIRRHGKIRLSSLRFYLLLLLLLLAPRLTPGLL